MQISVVPVGFAPLDRLTGVDATCLFVAEDDRPLHGLAGRVDWRLCGMLSRVLGEGRFVGALGDTLLLPGAGRIASDRIFCIGVGPAASLDLRGFARSMRRAADVLSLARATCFLAELPASSGVSPGESAAAFLAECAAHFPGEGIVLAGDAWALLKELHGRPAPPGVTIDREPLGAGSSVPAPGARPAPPARAGRGT